MVALLSHIIQSFRCLTSFLPSIHNLTLSLSANHSSLVHHLNIPLPLVIHKTLNKEFIDNFDEVLVIGDIHGCYDELIQLLDQINGNNNNNLDSNDSNNNQKIESNRILKLFVGDLVNKGPKNREVLEFMIKNSDNCLSVRGNHDEVVVKEYINYETNGESALKEKNLWVKDLTRKHVNYLISLPYTISIPSLNALVVHAGVVPNLDINSQNIRDLVEMRNLIIGHKTDNGSEAIISATTKHKEGVPWVSKWLGPQHIYFGHDAKRKLQMNQFSTGLDTGCVYGNSLTAVFIHGPRNGSLITVKANEVYSQPKGD